MQYKFNKHLLELLPNFEGRPKVLVAVSGGADSMCLLELLRNSSLDIEVAIAHVNFHLRGKESDMDEAFVRDWAERCSIPVYVMEADTTSYAKEHSLSIEMAAREIRYDWFYSLKKKYGFDCIAVAHHSNDNAETLLLNLTRGAGIDGIKGMRAFDPNTSVIRPLLPYSRQEIEKFLAKNGIPYRTDHTNLENDFARNRIRNLVIPQLEEINPSIVSVLNRDMEYFSAAASILERLAEDKKRELCHWESDAGAPFMQVVKSNIAKSYMSRMLAEYMLFHIAVAELLEQPEYSYWLYVILKDYGFKPSQIKDLSSSLHDGAVKRIISPTHIVLKERGYIKLYKEGVTGKVQQLSIDKGMDSVSLEVGAGVKLELEVVPVQSVGKIKENKEGIVLVADAGKIKFPLELRAVVAGDKFRPFGMDGLKKLNDYLSDIKIDNVLKERVPVLCNGDKKNSPDNIICMPGLQISNYYRITDKSKEALVITLV